MEKILYTAYVGDHFTIEWYFNEKGHSQAKSYFESSSVRQQDRLFILLKRMGDAGKIFDKTKFRNEGDLIYAFKPRPDRYLCFFIKGKKIIVTNAFTKKKDKLPKSEKEKALDCRDHYLKRVKEGSYYA